MALLRLATGPCDLASWQFTLHTYVTPSVGRVHKQGSAIDQYGSAIVKRPSYSPPRATSACAFAATCAGAVWSEASRAHCGDALAQHFDSVALAKTACDTKGAACVGLIDPSCDDKGPFYTCEPLTSAVNSTTAPTTTGMSSALSKYFMNVFSSSDGVRRAVDGTPISCPPSLVSCHPSPRYIRFRILIVLRILLEIRVYAS